MADNTADTLAEDEVRCACGAKVQRIKMDEHANTCAQAIVDCLFVNSGCPFKGTKSFLLEHVANNTTEHLNMLVKTVDSLSSELRSKNNLINTLQREVATLKATGISNSGYDKAPRSHRPADSGIPDPSKEERTMRTVHIGNVSNQITQEQLMSFFSLCGPVAQVRMAGGDDNRSRFAFVEFYTIEAAAAAIGLSGTMLYDRPIKVDYAKAPIVKGQASSGFSAPGIPAAPAYRYHPYM